MKRKEFLIELANRGSLKQDTSNNLFGFEYCWFSVKTCFACDLQHHCQEIFKGYLPHVKTGEKHFKDIANIHPEFFL